MPMSHFASQTYTQQDELQIADDLYQFIQEEMLPVVGIDRDVFWKHVNTIVQQFAPRNKTLLEKRDTLQAALDAWHQKYPGLLDAQNPDAPNSIPSYKAFLTEIGYLDPCHDDVIVTTENVDDELSIQAGPQLVVPLLNARYVLNAANARWGSLYDALYGTDMFSEDHGQQKEGGNGGYNPKRGALVINYCRHVLDRTAPLKKGSHVGSTHYQIHKGRLEVTLADGSKSTLAHDDQLVGFQGTTTTPSSILLIHHGLHIDIRLNASTPIGRTDPARICDLVIESALSTIVDLEDSVAAVDAADKVLGYRNWLHLLQGTLSEEVSKGGKTFTRTLNPDRVYQHPHGHYNINIPGRALLFVRNVGHLMTSSAILWKDAQQGTLQEIPEGILDAIVTSAIATVDLKRQANDPYPNSRKGSIYIVKPKMHGPEEVRFSSDLYAAVENMLSLSPNTIKLGIMDEERRTSMNLRACVAAAKTRLAFINTGFLDRTGDEIHSIMHAGPMLRKSEMKHAPWFKGYEANNVRVGLGTGMRDKAQIGKGMWAMPDMMKAMMAQKIVHARSGANTAWVPSPTAATLHALHYHQVNVAEVQAELEADYASRSAFKEYNHFLNVLLTLPITPSPTWTPQEIQQELDNNVQGILGYVVRWIEMGIGCSKVPDIHNVGLMEDRATLRISSQHIANWLLHNIVTPEQVRSTLERMAGVVDKQNQNDPAYVPMTAGDLDSSLAFQAASNLIFKGFEQPNGYTEPLLHAWRLKVKAHLAKKA